MVSIYCQQFVHFFFFLLSFSVYLRHTVLYSFYFLNLSFAVCSITLFRPYCCSFLLHISQIHAASCFTFTKFFCLDFRLLHLFSIISFTIQHIFAYKMLSFSGIKFFQQIFHYFHRMIFILLFHQPSPLLLGVEMFLFHTTGRRFPVPVFP